MTIIEYIKGSSFTQDAPLYDPGLGVEGVAHRWVGASLPTGSIDTWQPHIGSLPLSQVTAGLQPVSSAADGHKTLVTDGVDDTISAMSQMVTARTMTFLLRVKNPPGTTVGVISWDGGYLLRGSLGGAATTRIGAPTLNQSTSIDGPLFHTVTIINDFAGGVGATVIDADYGEQATDRENTNLIIGRDASRYGQIEVLDAAVWQRALTPNECQRVREAYQFKYSGLVA